MVRKKGCDLSDHSKQYDEVQFRPDQPNSILYNGFTFRCRKTQKGKTQRSYNCEDCEKKSVEKNAQLQYIHVDEFVVAETQERKYFFIDPPGEYRHLCHMSEDDLQNVPAKKARKRKAESLAPDEEQSANTVQQADNPQMIPLVHERPSPAVVGQRGSKELASSSAQNTIRRVDQYLDNLNIRIPVEELRCILDANKQPNISDDLSALISDFENRVERVGDPHAHVAVPVLLLKQLTAEAISKLPSTSSHPVCDAQLNLLPIPSATHINTIPRRALDSSRGGEQWTATPTPSLSQQEGGCFPTQPFTPCYVNYADKVNTAREEATLGRLPSVTTGVVDHRPYDPMPAMDAASLQDPQPNVAPSTTAGSVPKDPEDLASVNTAELLGIALNDGYTYEDYLPQSRPDLRDSYLRPGRTAGKAVDGTATDGRRNVGPKDASQPDKSVTECTDAEEIITHLVDNLHIDIDASPSVEPQPPHIPSGDGYPSTHNLIEQVLLATARKPESFLHFLNRDDLDTLMLVGRCFRSAVDMCSSGPLRVLDVVVLQEDRYIITRPPRKAHCDGSTDTKGLRKAPKSSLTKSELSDGNNTELVFDFMNGLKNSVATSIIRLDLAKSAFHRHFVSTGKLREYASKWDTRLRELPKVLSDGSTRIESFTHKRDYKISVQPEYCLNDADCAAAFRYVDELLGSFPTGSLIVHHIAIRSEFIPLFMHHGISWLISVEWHPKLREEDVLEYCFGRFRRDSLQQHEERSQRQLRFISYEQPGAAYGPTQKLLTNDFFMKLQNRSAMCEHDDQVFLYLLNTELPWVQDKEVRFTGGSDTLKTVTIYHQAHRLALMWVDIPDKPSENFYRYGPGRRCFVRWPLDIDFASSDMETTVRTKELLEKRLFHELIDYPETKRF